jgi:hypothetical protein
MIAQKEQAMEKCKGNISFIFNLKHIYNAAQQVLFWWSI